MDFRESSRIDSLNFSVNQKLAQFEKHQVLNAVILEEEVFRVEEKETKFKHEITNVGEQNVLDRNM